MYFVNEQNKARQDADFVYSDTNTFTTEKSLGGTEEKKKINKELSPKHITVKKVSHA